MILRRDLKRHVLLAPFERGADTLKVLSGYASASMAHRHIREIDQLVKDAPMRRGCLNVDIIYGMAKKDGVPLAQHRAFVEMVTEKYAGRISCNYLVDSPPVHGKIYVWLKNNDPIMAFLGSANYTQTAFVNSQVEFMHRCDASKALDIFSDYLQQSLECEHDDVVDEIAIHTADRDAMSYPDSVRLSFILERTGETPAKSGINWGQRLKRDRDQAYLRVPARVASGGFFPERGEHFTVMTDDEIPMICVIAQQGGKAIHTTESNALIGRYIRTRLGLPSGEYVTRDHFDSYGRTDVTVYKIDDETFHMDFSV